MSTLPAERDLPPAARDAARAELVAAVRRPASRPRRWVPVAAAAGLAAIVGASVAGVAALRDDAAPTTPGTTPTASPSPAGPTRAGLLASCLELVQPERHRSIGNDPDRSPYEVRALWRDRYGYMLWMGNRTMSYECTFAADGTRQKGAGGGASDTGYADTPVVGQGFGTSTASADTLAAHTMGRVGRGVAKVVVIWRNKPPVTAALEGPYFIARTVGVASPTLEMEDRPLRVDAYDAAGNKVGTYS